MKNLISISLLRTKIPKENKDIGIICKLVSLVPIYKSFIWPDIDIGDIIYDKPWNESFCDFFERVQRNAALAITSAIKGTSQLKFKKNLDLNLEDLGDGTDFCMCHL